MVPAKEILWAKEHTNQVSAAELKHVVSEREWKHQAAAKFCLNAEQKVVKT